MTYILDIILVLLFFIVVLVSTIRGFVKSVWRTFTVVGAFVIAYTYGTFVGTYLCDNYVNDYVAEYTLESLTEIVTDDSGNSASVDILDNAPEELIDLLERCGSDIDELRSFINNDVVVSEEELQVMAESISAPIARTISAIIGMIAVFVAGVILLSLFGALLRLILKLPIIRFIDSFLGMAFGLAEAFVVVWVVCLVIGFIVEHGFITGSTNEAITAVTDSSHLFRFFCDLSPVDFINIRIE